MRRAILILLVVVGVVLLLTTDRERRSGPGARPEEGATAPTAEPGAVKPEEGGATETVTVPVTDGVLRGRVLDRDGAPVARAIVRVLDGPLVHAVRGNYRIEGLSPGPKLVLAAASGHHPIPAATEIPESGEAVLDLRLEREGLPVAGRVVDQNDEPIAGARIRTWPRGPDWGFLWRLEHPPTGPDGAFRIEGLPDCPIRVSVDAKYHRVASQTVPAGRTDLIFRMDPAGEIAGRLVPPEGVDPKDPRIQISYEGRTASGTESNWFTSDPLDETFEGLSYRLKGLVPGIYVVRVRALDVGHGEVREIRVQAGKTTEVDIPLSVGGVLTGIVVDPDGRPIAGAYVVASEQDNLPAGYLLDGESAFLNDGADTRTDENGRYRIVGLAPGTYEVAARAKEYRYGLAKELPVPGTKEVPEIRLGRGGSVLVTAPGETDAWVYIGMEDDATLEGQIGADGRCRIESVPEGLHDLHFSGKSWGASFEVTVTSDEVTELTIERPAGAAGLSGRVTRGDRAVAGRRLTLVVRMSELRTVTFRARTDAEGSYRFAELPEGRARLSVRSAESSYPGTSREDSIDLKPGDNWLDVALPSASVRIRVVDARTGAGLRSRVICDGRDIGWTGRDGRVELTEVEPGQHEWIVEAEGHAPARFLATASEDPAENRVEVVPATELEIEVRDEKGEPLPDVLISIVDSSGWDLGTYASDWRFSDDRTGRQRFHLAAGSYRLKISEDGFETVTRDVTMPRTDGVLRIRMVRK